MDTIKSKYHDAIRDPNRIAELTRALIDFAKANFPDYASGKNNYGASALSNSNYWSMYYRVYADGTFMQDFKPGNQILLNYSALRIFAERLPLI